MIRLTRPLLRLAAVATAVAACGPTTNDSDATGNTSGSNSTSTSSGSTGPETPTSGAQASSGDDSSAETTEAPPTAAECTQDSDCVLINNCCECDAKPVDAPVAPCEGNCLQPTCEAMSLFGVRVACRSGVCEFANVPCSEGPVTCDEAMPSCPPGTRGSVEDGCWGPCVHPRYCADEGCPPEGCGDGWTCVEHQATGSGCVVVPLECAGTASCACVSPYLDEFCAASCIDDGMGALLCQDGG
jgi:hypothetical protein